ncbi:MAG: DUF4388 domain-containing protein [Myxococcota bacterium]
MVAIPQQGPLQDAGLAELLLTLEREGFGGSVQLTRGRLYKTLLFRDGAPVYAESNLASESLGVQLLDAGVLDRVQHLEVSKRMHERGCKEGAALLELGLLDAQGLFTALKGQVRARILQCFSWPDGSFRLDPEAMPSADTQPFRAGVPQLVQEGLEIHWPTARIRDGLTGQLDTAVFRTPRLSSIQSQLSIDDDAKRFLDGLEAGASLGSLLEGLRSPRALAAVWVMLRSEALLPVSCQEGVRAQPQCETLSAPEPSTDSRAPSQTARRPPTQLDQAFRTEIEETFAKLSDLDFYALLGVSSDANEQNIRRAYLDAATRFHPDALVRAGLGAAAREQATKIFAALGRARSQLSDSARRREYDASRHQQPGAEQEGERALAAETRYRKGEILMQQGNFRAAVPFLEASASLCPEEATYLGALGWALFKQNPPDLPGAEQHLGSACSLDPGNRELEGKLSQVRGESKP